MPAAVSYLCHEHPSRRLDWDGRGCPVCDGRAEHDHEPDPTPDQEDSE